MHVLVAHGSRTGGTAAIAHAISRRLEHHGVLAPVSDSRDVLDTGLYDAIVVGSALCAGRWRGDCVKLLKRLAKEEFAGPIWLFHSVLMADEDGRDHRAFPKHVIVYADRLDVRDWVRLGDVADEGPPGVDIDDTVDWDQVDAWADQIASVLTENRAA